MSKLLSGSDIAQVEKYVLDMKPRIIAQLKQGKVDEMRTTIEDKLKEEMVLCAKEFFENELKEDLLKQFASQKSVLINLGAEAINAIADGLKTQLTKVIADKIDSGYQAKKIIDALF